MSVEHGPKVAVVTDSTTSLSPRMAAELRKETGVHVVTLPSWIDLGEGLKRDYSISTDDIYEQIESKGLLETTHANPGQFERAYEALIEKFGVTEILSIHTDVRLTGGANSANTAAKIIEEKYPGSKIRVFDTESASAGALVLGLEAIEMAEQGLTVEEIVASLEAEKGNARLFVAITNASFFVKSAGRRLKVESLQEDVKKIVAAATIGLFNMYPVISLEEAGAKRKGMARGKNRIRENLAKLIEEGRKRTGLKKAIVLHTNCEEEAKKLARFLREESDIEISYICEAGTVLAVYAGKGCLGVGVLF